MPQLRHLICLFGDEQHFIVLQCHTLILHLWIGGCGPIRPRCQQPSLISFQQILRVHASSDIREWWLCPAVTRWAFASLNPSALDMNRIACRGWTLDSWVLPGTGTAGRRATLGAVARVKGDLRPWSFIRLTADRALDHFGPTLYGKSSTEIIIYQIISYIKLFLLGWNCPRHRVCVFVCAVVTVIVRLSFDTASHRQNTSTIEHNERVRVTVCVHGVGQNKTHKCLSVLVRILTDIMRWTTVPLSACSPALTSEIILSLTSKQLFESVRTKTSNTLTLISP